MSYSQFGLVISSCFSFLKSPSSRKVRTSINVSMVLLTWQESHEGIVVLASRLFVVCFVFRVSCLLLVVGFKPSKKSAGARAEEEEAIKAYFHHQNLII